MAGYDRAAAKAAGYSDAEIDAHLRDVANTRLVQQAQAANLALPGDTDSPADSSGLDFASQLHSALPSWLGSTEDVQRAIRPLARGNEGVGRGMVHTVNAVGNLLGQVPDAALADEKRIDAPLLATDAGSVGNLTGEGLMTTPLGGGATQLVSKIAPKLAASALGSGAIQGGTMGLATSDPGDRLINTAVGIGAGVMVPAISGTASRLVRGLKRTPEAQKLLDEGIDLTPGQMNPHGSMNLFEQSAESLGILKPIIHGARDNAESQYQARLIQTGAMPGVTIKPSENLADMLQQAYDSYHPYYDQAKGYPTLPKIMNVGQGGDVPLADAFMRATRLPGTSQSVQRKEAAWLQDKLTQLPKNPKAVMSDHLLDLRSDIRTRARNFRLTNTPEGNDRADILDRAQRSITDALNSQLPPEPMTALSDADKQYGKYKIVEDAIAKAKDNHAQLTPSKMSNAIAAAHQNGTYARGAGGEQRDLAKAGTDVFQVVNPPTGARVATLGAAVPFALHNPLTATAAATGMLGAVATPTGRRIAQGATKPQRLVQALVDKFGAGVNAVLPPSGKGAAKALTRGAAIANAQPLVPGTAQALGSLILRQNAAGVPQAPTAESK